MMTDDDEPIDVMDIEDNTPQEWLNKTQEIIFNEIHGYHSTDFEQHMIDLFSSPYLHFVLESLDDNCWGFLSMFGGYQSGLEEITLDIEFLRRYKHRYNHFLYTSVLPDLLLFGQITITDVFNFISDNELALNYFVNSESFKHLSQEIKTHFYLYNDLNQQMNNMLIQ